MLAVVGGVVPALATAPFSPFTGRRCRQADEGRRQLLRIRRCPSSGPSDHLLPVERGEGKRGANLEMLALAPHPVLRTPSPRETGRRKRPALTSCSWPASPSVPW
ncbi:hypothetical protein EN852_018570 [Mesorhizobium sp. M2E.F.Ca.ET.209.01.1.1]|nr:hypothetical protein EN852_018570 [Mesorhizobium sp. M2E.F.Ca.ET.209.01.1.1]